MENDKGYLERRKFLRQTALAGAGLATAYPLANLFSQPKKEKKTARVFITGSSDGMGLPAAQALIAVVAVPVSVCWFFWGIWLGRQRRTREIGRAEPGRNMGETDRTTLFHE